MYGARPIPSVLTGDGAEHFTNSVWLQLEKPDRRFTYHIEKLPANRLRFNYLTSNGRAYKIHLNMVHDATSSDILDSYFFARLLD